MNDIIKIHKAFSHVVFDPNYHTYTNTKTSEKLTSVTTYIKKYTNKFDTRYWTLYKSLQANGYHVNPGLSINELESMYSLYKNLNYNHITPEFLENEWETKRILSAAIGTYVHAIAEQRFLNKLDVSYTEDKDVIEKAQPAVKQVLNFIENNTHLVPVKLELVVTNTKDSDINVKLAGQADALLFDIDACEYVLLDFKTDEEIEFSNKYQKMKGSLSHLDDCSFNKYCIQLSLYRYMIERYAEITIGRSIIVNINKSLPAYRVHQIPYLEKEIKTILHG